MEQWKEVESKGRKWLVSSLGNVRAPSHTTIYSRERNGKMQTFTSIFPERDIAKCISNHGYFEAQIQTGGKRRKESVHRLVGLAFVDGYTPDLSINHKDGNKLNNLPSNLEWVSLAKNTEHEWATGLVDLRGDNHPGKVLTSKRVVYIRKLLNLGISEHTISIVAGVSNSAIHLIAQGKRWASV